MRSVVVSVWLLALVVGCAKEEVPRSPTLRPSPAASGPVGVPLPPDILAWRALRSFTYARGEPLPETVQALDGQTVTMKGYLMFIEEDLYLLVEALWSHHVGHPPELNEAVVTRSPVDRRSLQGCPVTARGVLSVGEEVEGEYVTSLYRMEATSIALDPTRRTPDDHRCDPR